MKFKFVLASVVATLSGLAGFASTANAGTDLSIRIGIGSRRPMVVAPECPPAPPVYGRHSGHRPMYRGHHAPQGYWKNVVVRTWVPARWVVSCDHRGREVRMLQRGYYTERIDRVWVGYGRG